MVYTLGFSKMKVSKGDFLSIVLQSRLVHIFLHVLFETRSHRKNLNQYPKFCLCNIPKCPSLCSKYWLSFYSLLWAAGAHFCPFFCIESKDFGKCRSYLHKSLVFYKCKQLHGLFFACDFSKYDLESICK